MKKVIVLSLTVLLIAAAAGGGTWAYFSDTETSQDNTLIAGTLNLKVGDNDPCTESIDLGIQLKPGDSGNAADWTMANTGSISGSLGIGISNIANYENTRIEPEEAAGDTTSGADEGELGDYVDIAVWLDVNRSGGWDSGDMYLKSDGTVVSWASGSSVPPEAYDDLNNYDSAAWDAADGLPTIASGDDLDFMVEYDFPSDPNDNRAQSDSSVFDINFTLEQV
jgi:spore coat-associated protein N